MNFRPSRELESAFRECADYYGHSISDALRFSTEMFACAATLRMVLTDPQIQARMGEDVAEIERSLRQRLDALEARAFDRPSPENVFDNLINPN